MKRNVTATDYFYSGNANYDQGNLVDAISDYTKSIERDPNFSAAYTGRGNAYYKQGKLAEAISDFTKAIELDPNFAKPYNNRGVAYFEQGKLVEAFDGFTKAIELDPNLAIAYFDRGQIYYIQENFAEAISDFTKAIERNPYYTIYTAAYNHRGITYYYQGKLAEAISDFTKAIELDPNFADPCKNLKDSITSQKKSKLFDLFKTLPAEKLIPLLKYCLDRNTILGKWFLKPEECNMEDDTLQDTLQEMKNHFSNSVENMAIWTFLIGPKHVRQHTLVEDTFLLITSYFLQLNGLKADFNTINNYQPKINKFQKEISITHPSSTITMVGMLQQNTNKSEQHVDLNKLKATMEMSNQICKNKKYEFQYVYDNHNYSKYIIINRELTTEELNILDQLLPLFPHATDFNWRDKFLLRNFDIFPKDILHIAANAYDGFGNTMLGVACEYGKSVEIVQKLIDLGANLNTPDHNMKKLPLHWAICNKRSFFKKESYEAAVVVKCLLENGARTDITCYENKTPLEYAESRGYKAAANLIKAYKKVYLRGATIGLFKQAFPRCVGGCISDYLELDDGVKIAMTNKDSNNAAKMENKHTNINCFLKKM